MWAYNWLKAPPQASQGSAGVQAVARCSLHVIDASLHPRSASLCHLHPPDPPAPSQLPTTQQPTLLLSFPPAAAPEGAGPSDAPPSHTRVSSEVSADVSDQAKLLRSAGTEGSAEAKPPETVGTQSPDKPNPTQLDRPLQSLSGCSATATAATYSPLQTPLSPAPPPQEALPFPPRKALPSPPQEASPSHNQAMGGGASLPSAPSRSPLLHGVLDAFEGSESDVEIVDEPPDE